jgi:hypothetical protein
MPVDQDLGHVDRVERSPRQSGSCRLLHREQPSTCEDHTGGNTLTFPLENYVSDILGNYVNGNLKLEFH